MQPARALVPFALTALLLAALALPVLAQTTQRPTETLDTPNFLENLSKPPTGESADSAPPAAEAAPVAPPKSAVRAPVARAPDPEEPPSSVPADEPGASEDKESKTAPRNTVIEPYPQNPRCYVAGVYMPAPPLCPN